MKRTLLLAAFVCAGSAQALIVDDFTTGSFNLSVTSGDVVASQAGTMLGLERDVALGIVSNPLNLAFQAQGGSGLTVVSGGVLVAGVVMLDYDGGGDETDNQLPLNQGPGLNLNLTGQDRFVLNFRANDLQIGIRTTVFSYGNGSWEKVTAVTGSNASPFAHTILFSDFIGASFSDVDRIVFEFETQPGGDFALGSIQAVPEPGTLAALGLGAVALLRRRRA